MKASPNHVIIRRITSVKAIRAQSGKREIIGFKADCNHSNPPETKVFPLSQWGAIAFELAQDWALLHKCRGDYYHDNLVSAMQEIANASPRRLHSVGK